MAKIYRQAVMAVIINAEDKVLIGYSPRDESYKFPQGGLEQEEELVTGITRELKEELDYDLDPDCILDVYQEKVRYPFPPDCHPIFMGQELSIVKIRHQEHCRTVPQDDEFDKLIWIKPSEIQNFDAQYRQDAYFQALQICQLI